MNDRQLRKALKEGLSIHRQWAAYQRRLKRRGKRQVQNVGGVRWHERWIRIYQAALRKI